MTHCSNLKIHKIVLKVTDFLTSESAKLFILASFTSARNPPPICVGIPYLEKEASICIDIYDIDYSKNFGACIKLEARLYHVKVEDVELGCFHIPLTWKQWARMRENDGMQFFQKMGSKFATKAEKMKEVFQKHFH